jgi:hypothetical protein
MSGKLRGTAAALFLPDEEGDEFTGLPFYSGIPCKVEKIKAGVPRVKKKAPLKKKAAKKPTTKKATEKPKKPAAKAKRKHAAKTKKKPVKKTKKKGRPR